MTKLTSHVYVDGKAYGPDDDLDESTAAQIGEHAFQDGQHPHPGARAAFLDPVAAAAAAAAIPKPPPLTGRGGSKTAWAAYADALGVDLDGVDDSRDAIVTAITEAGHPVEPVEQTGEAKHAAPAEQ